MQGRYEAGKRGEAGTREIKGVRGRYEADKRGTRQVKGVRGR